MERPGSPSLIRTATATSAASSGASRLAARLQTLANASAGALARSDNLDTRLILLKRRLEERGSPIQLLKTGRARFVLQLAAVPRPEVRE